MPNWCSDTLTVVGPKESLDRFERITHPNDEIRDGDTSDFTMERLVPRPDPKSNADPMDWLSDVQNYWGVKWSESDCSEAIRNDAIMGTNLSSLRLEIATPWGPPDTFMYHASRMFPDLIFDMVYDESGMDFGGHIVFRDGEVLISEEGNSTAYWEDEEDEDGNPIEPPDQHPEYILSDEDLGTRLEEDILKRAMNCD